jgi:hypothetical protein
MNIQQNSSNFFHEAIETNLAAAEPLGNKKKIDMLCETRWSARSDSFASIKNGIFPLVTSMEMLQEERDEKIGALLFVVLQFYFLLTVVILATVLPLTSTLSSKIQCETLDLNDAARYTEITITKLQSWVDECTAPEGNNIMSDCEAQNAQPNPSEYNKFYEEAKSIALLLGVQESFPRAVRRQVHQLAQFADIKDHYKNNYSFIF